MRSAEALQMHSRLCAVRVIWIEAKNRSKEVEKRLRARRRDLGERE